GRTVFTTTEWNSLTSTGISFKIKAESQEGIWVEEPLSRNDMVNIFLPNSNAFTSEQKATITEINFVRMKEENINTHSNLIDLTASGGEGVVKAWIENNKLYIASPGATWFPVDSSGLLSNFDAVTTINFNNINTSQVTNMMGMISHLPLLTSIDLSKFDTSNVTTMSAMFTGNTSLQSIDLSNLDVGNLTNMVAMFDGCTNLVSVNLSNLNTTNLTYLNSTFSSCSSLTTVNLTNFNTTNVTSYTNMFGGCTSLTTLDLSSFTISSGSSVHAMFTNDSSLTTIYVSNLWNPNNLAGYGIFEGCTSIVGGSGTTYDSSHVDDDYAKVDGGQSNPGYLTLKTN
ncbi:MAG: BspA family leucine-rich repeat surface protein, partial [Bacilli bacterium]|nr:BspA family leucine-rich repeat surface protein [Bacilli bacterium]